MQEVFDASLEKAFRNKKVTIGLGIASIILAIVLFINLDQQLFPTVERNQCAVEVFLDRGSSLESTVKIHLRKINE